MGVFGFRFYNKIKGFRKPFESNQKLAEVNQYEYKPKKNLDMDVVRTQILINKMKKEQEKQLKYKEEEMRY